MLHRFSLLLLALLPLSASPESPAPEGARITSSIETTAAGERILAHEVLIHAPVADVWAAHTTDEGWTAWSSPHAKIDLRIGGTILTHYGEDAKIGDPGTNTLHIVNYVPQRVLTLRADVSDNWPELLKQNADKMSNVILFDEAEPGWTRLRSYGIGYLDSPEYDSLLAFFESANTRLYEGLIAHLESDGPR